MTRSPRATLKDRARRLDHAIASLTAAQAAHGAAVVDILAARSVRCAARCPGWFIGEDSSGTTAPQRCDECAAENGYLNELRDDDLIYVPAVVRALRKAFADVEAKEADSNERQARDLGLRIGELMIRLRANGSPSALADLATCELAIDGDRTALGRVSLILRDAA